MAGPLQQSMKQLRYQVERPGGEPEALARLLGELGFAKYNTKHVAMVRRAWGRPCWRGSWWRGVGWSSGWWRGRRAAGPTTLPAG
jgi:hypothetical protein